MRDENHDNSDKTIKYDVPLEEEENCADILKKVTHALQEKGYNPINQLVGYFMSGDPTYITSHMDARSLIRKKERDELLEEILEKYLQDLNR